jgi:hypothetical protein
MTDFADARAAFGDMSPILRMFRRLLRIPHRPHNDPFWTIDASKPNRRINREWAPIGSRKMRIEGDPDIDHVSTSYAERTNLTVRMHTRRFTRLTNGFSKKVENHAHSVALFAMYYNFVRVHKTLRVTPAMAANVTKRLWEMSDIVDVLEAWEALGVW